MLARITARIGLIACLAAALSVGCSDSKTTPSPTQNVLIQRQDALRLAHEAAVNAGMKFEGYKAPEVQLDTDEKGQAWVVSYEGRENIPGNYFYVIIDAKTGAAHLMLGE